MSLSLNDGASLARLTARLLNAAGDGITDDTTSINAQLAAAPAGSVLRGVAGKNYLVSAPIRLRPGGQQTLDMTGCTITLAVGSNCNLVNNAAVTPAATASDAAITSGSSTLTTAIAGAAVGQTVTVAGAGANGNGPLTANITAVGAGTLTLSVPAQATVSAAAVKLFTRDSKVRVIGGTWVRGTNGGTGSNLHSLLFRHVDDLILDAEAITSGAGKYAISIADATAVWVRARGLNTFSDGVHLMGPISGARIEEITGTTSDDTFAITAADWPAYGDSTGDVRNVSVGRIDATSTAANLCKVIAGAGQVVDNFRVTDGVYGRAALNAAWCGDDTGQAATTGGTYGAIDFGTVGAAAPSNLLALYAPSARLIRVRFASAQTTPLGQFVSVLSTGTATIGQLFIDGAALSPPSGFVGYLVRASNANATINQVTIANARFAGADGGLFDLVAGTVDEVVVSYCRYDMSGTLGFWVRHEGGTLNRVSYVGGTFKGGSVAFRKDVGAGSGTTAVSMSNGFTVSGASRVADCRVGTTVFLLGNPRFDTLTNAAFFTNGGTLVFDGSVSGTFTMLQRNAAESVRSLGASLPFDVSALARANGDAAYNTNAALACGAGRVVSDGVNWKNLFSGLTY